MTQAEITPPLFSKDTDTKGALEVLEWAYETYGDNLAYARLGS